jgi:Fe-Mn family superoxide dismutase
MDEQRRAGRLNSDENTPEEYAGFGELGEYPEWRSEPAESALEAAGPETRSQENLRGVSMMEKMSYKPKHFNLSKLQGISDKTLETHFKLYEGYVKSVNELNEKIADVLKAGKVDQEEFPAYSELTRRLGFEYNGMVLHEYYFQNLKSGGTGVPAPKSNFAKAAEATFGSYDLWKVDFVGVGKMRGVGWAMCYQDPNTGRISNHWITLHETGNVAGFIPILFMDVWEHAFILDYAPSDRPKYIDAFFSNIDWDAVQKRVKADLIAPSTAA